MVKVNKHSAKTYKNYRNIRNKTEGSNYNSRMDPHAPSANITTPPSQGKMTIDDFAGATGLTGTQLIKEYDVYEEHYRNYEDGSSRVHPNTFVDTRVPTRHRSRTRARKRTRSRAQKRARSRAHRLR
jgi:hypothetical protein